MASPQWPAPTTTVVVSATAAVLPGRCGSGHVDGDAVGLVRMS